MKLIKKRAKDGFLVGRIVGLGSGGRLRGGGIISGSLEFKGWDLSCLCIVEAKDIVMCVLCCDQETAYGNRGEAVSKNQ